MLYLEFKSLINSSIVLVSQLAKLETDHYTPCYNKIVKEYLRKNNIFISDVIANEIISIGRRK